MHTGTLGSGQSCRVTKIGNGLFWKLLGCTILDDRFENFERIKKGLDGDNVGNVGGEKMWSCDKNHTPSPRSEFGKGGGISKGRAIKRNLELLQGVATPSAIHHVAIIASALATFRPYHALAFLPFTLSPSNDDHHPRRQFRRPIYPFVKISRLRLDFIGNSSATMTTTTTADNVGIIYCRRFLITLVIDCEMLRNITGRKLCINCLQKLVSV